MLGANCVDLKEIQLNEQAMSFHWSRLTIGQGDYGPNTEDYSVLKGLVKEKTVIKELLRQYRPKKRWEITTY